MNDQKATLPKWFWVVGGLSLIWNLMGVMAYIAQVTMSAETLAALPEAERMLYEATPIWVTGAFALAVWGGALGCVALLLRKKWATPVFAVSLIGIVAQMSYVFFMSKSFEVYGPGSAVMPAMVMLIAVALLWFSNWSAKQEWLS